MSQVADRSTTGHAESVAGQFGYRQEFNRELKRFASFAVGFSFISITTGIFTTYGGVLNWGGPRGIWTWPFVAVGQTLVALVFAMLASRIPLAGYSYQWASRLTNPKIGWLIGWVSFTFLIVVTVSVDYALAQVALPSLLGYTANNTNQWIVTGAILLVQALLISFSTRWATRVNNTAVATEIIGIVGLTLLLIVIGAARGMLHPDHLFSTGVVPTSGYWSLGTSFTHIGPFVFSFLLGAYTIVGFEAAANLAEETEDPERAVPNAMWMAVVLSGIVGFIFLIALNLALGDIKAASASATPVADIINNVLGTFLGKIFLIFVSFSIFACGLVIFMTGSRLTWAMSRDLRFPGGRVLRQVNPSTNTPLAAVTFLFVVMEVVLAIFSAGNRPDVLVNLFSASTLLPCIIYLVTTIMYISVRSKLPKSSAFNLGSFEWPVVVLALVWLLWELSIFRDASFKLPWQYVGVMFLIGVVYFAYMLVAQRHVLDTEPTTSPAAIAE